MSKKFTSLSSGALNRMIRGEEVECPLVMQIISSKRIPANNPSAQNRYRLVISDGESTHSFAMLATSLNEAYEEGRFSDFSIVSINRYVPSPVNRNEDNERKVIIVFEMETLHPGSEVGCKIEQSASAQKENIKVNSNQASSHTSNPKPAATVQNTYAFSGSTQPDNSSHLTVPIEYLSPYSNKWVIKARVTSKSTVRTWSNTKGEGKLFNVELQDETGEIRCTFFNAAVDRFYDMLQVDKVYYISRCTLKPANKQFNKLKNDYEMSAGNETHIQECMEDCDGIPKIHYNFVTIKELAEKNKDDIVDIIAVCKEASPVQKFIAKTSGREMTKRDVTLIDQSKSSIVLTLWGNDAEAFSEFDNPVVLLKSARLSEFNGSKNLSTTSSTIMKTNPDLTEGHTLRGWFENGGADGDFDQLSARTGGTGNLSTEWLTFQDIKQGNLGIDKPVYFQTCGMIQNIRMENMVYKACPKADCNKKVVEQEDGSYRCEKCSVNSHDFKYKLLLSMCVGDWTSNRWTTAFSETAEKILGKTTNEIAYMLENSKTEMEQLVAEKYFQPRFFKMRYKLETYNDITRGKTSLIAVDETSYKDYNRYLLKNIQRLTGISVDSASN